MGRGTVYPFIWEKIARRIGKNSLVLETGCGGAAYRPLCERLQATYIGTDVRNEHYQDAGDVDIYCSADQLPFADNSFYLVFNQGAIDYMPKPDVVLREAWRVLKPGGFLLIFTYTREVLLEINRNCGKTQRRWELDHWVFDSQQMLAMLACAGFRAKEISGSLNTWKPASVIESIRLVLNGKLAVMRLANSIWRAFEARKPRSAQRSRLFR